MIDMTPAGRQKLEEYLQKLRAAVRRLPPAEAEDLEQSVREHVDVALAGMPAPVGTEQVISVLDRLGTPDRWVPQSEQPIWRIVMERLRNGPEEWRLAYLTFGLFAAGIVLLPIGIGALVLILSFLGSRAYVEFMRTKEEPLGARRWLVYPPLALFLLIGLGLTVVGPAGPLVAWGVGDHELHRLLDIDLGSRGNWLHTRFDAGAAAVIFGAWWMIASTALAIFLPVVRFLFVPLLDGVRRKHLLVLTAIGAVVFALGWAILDPFWRFAF
jgi:hypothetical protein